MFALRRFASAFALCALFLGILAVAVQAASVPRFETNGQRMARGLTPLRPRALYPDSTTAARRSTTSSKPNTCPAGLTSQCCDSIEGSNTSLVTSLLAILGIKLTAVTQVGVTCGAGTLLCAGVSLCCEEVAFGGLLSIGCSLLADVGI